MAPKRYPFPMRDIFSEGRRGFRNYSANPFRPHSDRYREWERGFNYEYFKAQKRATNFIYRT